MPGRGTFSLSHQIVISTDPGLGVVVLAPLMRLSPALSAAPASVERHED